MFSLCTVDAQKILFVYRISLLSPFSILLSSSSPSISRVGKGQKVASFRLRSHAASVATTHLPPGAKAAPDSTEMNDRRHVYRDRLRARVGPQVVVSLPLFYAETV